MADVDYEAGEERISTFAAKGMAQVEPGKPRDAAMARMSAWSCAGRR